MERGFTALSLLESPTGNGGFVTLREALQSPASGGEAKLRAEIGDEDVMWRLRDVGLRDASTAENARTSLWELAQAYAALARSGRWRPLNPFTQPTGYAERPAFREDAASLVNNMLAPDGHIAIHSTQAAEGAWTVLYGFKHLVAIWLEKPQDPQQPARLARALAVSALNGQTLKPLHISSRLKARQVCREGTKIKASDGRCPAWTEYLPVSRVH